MWITLLMLYNFLQNGQNTINSYQWTTNKNRSFRFKNIFLYFKPTLTSITRSTLEDSPFLTLFPVIVLIYFVVDTKVSWLLNLNLWDENIRRQQQRPSYFCTRSHVEREREGSWQGEKNFTGALYQGFFLDILKKTQAWKNSKLKRILIKTQAKCQKNSKTANSTWAFTI